MAIVTTSNEAVFEVVSVREYAGLQHIGEVRARMIKDGLGRLAEASILERYS